MRASTLNEISGLTKMSVKRRGGGNYLGKNAASFHLQENQQEKRELDGNFQDRKCHPIYFPTNSPSENIKL